jgi:hypothetical protein
MQAIIQIEAITESTVAPLAATVARGPSVNCVSHSPSLPNAAPSPTFVWARVVTPACAAPAQLNMPAHIAMLMMLEERVVMRILWVM